MNNQNNIWLFGNNSGLDFNPLPMTPVAFTGTLNISTDEGCASISDTITGNLLFYTDGRTVYNNSGGAFETALLGDSSSTSSAIIVPVPGSTTLYYIFTVDSLSGNNNGLQYSIVDTSNPMAPFMVGAINRPLESNAFERVIAIKKENCKDYWVISTDNLGSTFFTFSITQSNITQLPNLNIGAQTVISIGYLKASPTGNKLALATSNGLVETFDFNNSTGIISNQQIVSNNITRVYGVEFSNNGNLLYFSTLSPSNGTGTGSIYQKVLNNTNLPVLIGTIQNNGTRYACGALQMGPNGIIYIAIDEGNSLAAIQLPDTIDTGANESGFMEDAIMIGPAICKIGLPTLVQFQHCEDGNCLEIDNKVNAILSEKCENKLNFLNHCDERKECSCVPKTDCVSLDFPDIKPCISIKWGDDKCDYLESDDYEVMCLTVCNCFSNITLNNFKIGLLQVCNEDGSPVDNLPDGTPSIQLIPVGPYCFGSIDPCSCISREFIVLIKGARDGKYKIKVLGVCFDVCFHYDHDDCFEFHKGCDEEPIKLPDDLTPI